MNETIDTLVLASGPHESREDGMCAMEAVAWLASEPHSDHPQCVSPVIASFVRAWNDRLVQDARQELKRILPSLKGTNTCQSDDARRVYMAADWAVREILPIAMRAAHLQDHADALQALAPIVDRESAMRASSAAYDAAYSAASSAARSAAYYAAYSASDAAYSASSAAYSAAYSARSAASSAFVRESALRLIVRMCEARA